VQKLLHVEIIPPPPLSKVLTGSQCVARHSVFCNNTLNYTETVYPNLSGDKSEDDFVRSWAFLQTVIDSFWYRTSVFLKLNSTKLFSLPYISHPLIEQFVCQAAQPECRQDGTIGPCRQLCLGKKFKKKINTPL
jgi:hypothetical protein